MGTRRDPVEAVMVALRSLAISRGAGIVGIARAAGQDRVKINVKAFYKHHEEETGYTLFEEALADLGEEGLVKLQERGIRIVRLGRETYIEVPVVLLEELSKGSPA